MSTKDSLNYFANSKIINVFIKETPRNQFHKTNYQNMLIKSDKTNKFITQITSIDTMETGKTFFDNGTFQFKINT